jgi:hypothetical protein
LIYRRDADKFNDEIGRWLLEQKLFETPAGLKGRGIAIDGKTVRGSHNGARKGINLLSAVIHKEVWCLHKKRWMKRQMRSSM